MLILDFVMNSRQKIFNGIFKESMEWLNKDARKKKKKEEMTLSVFEFEFSTGQTAC